MSDEIERLRKRLSDEIENRRRACERIEELEKERDEAERELWYPPDLRRAHERIEELLSYVDGNDKDQQIMDLEERIEQLEGMWKRVVEKDTYYNDKHFISKKQIDLAWKYWTTYGTADVKSALEELNIMRCEKCGGSGEASHLRKSPYTGCPDCDGHGWRTADE